jgi:hypothetical protein
MNSTSNPFDLNFPSPEIISSSQLNPKITLLFLSLLLLTFLFTFLRILVEKMIKSIAFSNSTASLIKELKQSSKLSLIPFILSSTLNISIYSWLQFDIPIHFTIVVLFVILMLKLISVSFVGYVYPVSEALSNYFFVYVIFFSAFGVLIVPINLILAFADFPTQIISMAGIVLGIALSTLAILRILNLNLKWILPNKFHFLLYICTVEIAPLLVIYKVLPV